MQQTDRPTCSKCRNRTPSEALEPRSNSSPDANNIFLGIGLLAMPGYKANVAWRAPTLDELRGSPGFLALPPPSDVVLSHPRCYRFVRQDTSLWDALHSGTLTTSCFAGLLGVREPKAARTLGVPRHLVNHGAMQGAHARLLEPRVILKAAKEVRLLPSDALSINRAAVEAFNSRAKARAHAKAALDGETSSSFDPPPASAAAEAFGAAQVALDRQRQENLAHFGELRAHHPLAELIAKRPPSFVGSINRVRCSWGNAQEPSSLMVLCGAIAEGRCHGWLGRAQRHLGQQRKQRKQKKQSSSRTGRTRVRTRPIDERVVSAQPLGTASIRSVEEIGLLMLDPSIPAVRALLRRALAPLLAVLRAVLPERRDEHAASRSRSRGGSVSGRGGGALGRAAGSAEDERASKAAVEAEEDQLFAHLLPPIGASPDAALRITEFTTVDGREQQ